MFSKFLLDIAKVSGQYSLCESIAKAYALCEAYAYDADAIADVNHGYSGISDMMVLRNALTTMIKKPEFYDVVHGTRDSFDKWIDKPNYFTGMPGFWLKAVFSMRGQGDSQYAMAYDGENNIMTVCIDSLCKIAGYDIKPEMSNADIYTTVMASIDKNFSNSFLDMMDSAGEFFIHENRHRIDSFEDKNILNDNDERNKIFADADFYSNATDADSVSKYRPVSKVYRNDNLFLNNFDKLVAIEPNYSNRMKQYVLRKASVLLNELFSCELYNKHFPDSLVKELEGFRYSVTTHELIAAAREKLVSDMIEKAKKAGKPLSADDCQAIRDAYNDQTITDASLMKDPEATLQHYRAIDAKNKKTLFDKACIYTRKLYYNQIAEVNAYITQQIPRIAMLKKNNEDTVNVDYWVEYFFNRIGGSYMIPDVAAKAKNRLYTLITAANNISLDFNSMRNPNLRTASLKAEVKKLING